MSNYWALRGWSVSILTLTDGGDVPFYELNPGVEHLPLDLAWESSNRLVGIVSNLRRIRGIRLALQRLRPDVVISFMGRTNVVTLLATRALPTPVVVSERNDPARPGLDPIWRRLRDLLYTFADIVVVQTERARGYFPSVVQERCVVIPNPVTTPAEEAQEDSALIVGRPAIVAMGRLTGQKGFDLLLAAFAQLRERFPQWRLMVIGEGPMRSDLEAQVERLRLQDCVTLVGRLKCPGQVLRQADLFVMPSRYEGFPNALCEAMAWGLPVISFDCPNGPREIIRDGVDGILVPPGDVSALVAAMARLLADESLRGQLGSRAPEITSRFGLTSVMSIWEETLSLVMSGGRARRSQAPRFDHCHD